LPIISAATETLFVEYNKFEGTLPDMSGMDRLVNIHLNHNQMKGPLPEGLSSLKHVRLIKLGGNKFTGTIPAGWFDESKPLVLLDLGGIEGITGTLPTEVGSVGATLEDLRLEGNLLSGALPAEMGKLSQLRTCFLNGNKFTGTIPSELSGMIQVENIRFHGNQLTGSMPSSICAIEKEFEAQKNKQMLISADCKTGSITCDCCHKCY